MSLKETLLQDMKVAMKEKDTIRKNTIQLLRTAILQLEKDEKIEVTDEKALEVVASQVKKRKSSLPEYEKSGRQDLVDELLKEIDVLMSYLPKQLNDEELMKIVDEVISELQATSMKDMGKIMSAIVPRIKGRADNKRISSMVKQKLSS